MAPDISPYRGKVWAQQYSNRHQARTYDARVANATVTTSPETLEACGRVGPDPSSPKLFVGSRKRLGSGGALIEGAAVVGHDVDCSSPGKPAPNKYVCPEAVDRTVQGRPCVPGPPQQPGRRRPG